jgi:hypothetical protein
MILTLYLADFRYHPEMNKRNLKVAKVAVESHEMGCFRAPGILLVSERI